MNKISAVIITKNEEKNIRRCIDSIKDIVDEIIVIDSFSSDNTEKICSEYNVRFVKREFKDYSDAKNYGNSLAQHPFILSMDADEEVSKELKQSILSVKSNRMEDGYSFNRRTNYCGHWIYHCGWYPDTKLRLFRKSKSSWKGKIHETLHLQSDNRIHLKGDLLHYSFPDIKSHAEKVNLFTELAAKDSFNRKKKVSMLKLLFAPLFEFFNKMIFHRGFLDGYYGFVISMMSAYYKFYKYAKLKDLWKRQNAITNKKATEFLPEDTIQ